MMSLLVRSLRRFVFCMAALCLIVLGVPVKTGALSPPPWCDGDGDGVVNARELPTTIPSELCDLSGVQINDYGVGVVAGAPGTGVYGEALLEDGKGFEELQVTTQEDGTVVLSHVGEEQMTEDVGEDNILAPAACEDPAYNLLDFKESDQHQFRINTSTIPSRNNVTNTVEGIRAGGRNITDENTDCQGWTDHVSADILYLGTTSRRADLSDGACQNFAFRDDVNVVDFGFIAKKASGSIVVGLECHWFVITELVESDIRLNSSHAQFYNTGTCNGQEYHIESIMTHERGHTFGMWHSGSGHDHLTMYGVARKCITKQRTLGKGDMLGLRTRY